MPTTFRRDDAADTHEPRPTPSDFRDPPRPINPRGWTVERQRGFLTALAETGSVTHAAAAIGLSARSAYRLRARPDAEGFGVAWDEALRIAAGRLTALAFERAITGRVRQLWKDGELVATTREPSDKLLMFLLTSFNHRQEAGSAAQQREFIGNDARRQLPGRFERLADSDCAVEAIQADDIVGASLSSPLDEEEPLDLD